MKALLTSGLVALGLFAASARAEEIQWRSARPAAPAAAPVGLGRPLPDGDTGSGRAVTLGKVRAQADAEDPRPLPLGPSLGGDPKIGPPKAGEPKVLGEPRTGDPKDKVKPRAEYIPTPPTMISGVPHGVDGCGPDACCDDACCGPVRSWLRNCWNHCFRPVMDCCDAGPCGAGPCAGPCDNGLCHGGLFGGWLRGCNDGCCCNQERFWVNAGYLAWVVSKQETPPLVTVNPTGAPFLGNPGTTVALGGKDLDRDWRSGGRIQAGWWLPCHQCWGIDAGAFYIGHQNDQFMLSSNGTPQIGRPFINADNGLPFAELVAGGATSGSIFVDHQFSLWGADMHLRHRARESECGWLDWFIGYRYLNLDERLTINENPRTVSTVAPVTQFFVMDRFGTQNIFNGADLGVQWERRLGRRWFWQGSVKVALGYMAQSIDITGMTTRLVGGVSTSAVGGFAALPSNIGNFSSGKFAVIPEVGIKVGFDVTDHLRLFVGYDFMWINSVVRPGEQIDPNINLGQVPFRGGANTGQNRPAVLFRTSDFWAQGVNFGLEYRY
ncbi:MAG: BBP7 family outer membrane beta-barrel protein [Gemmataceae bacterium]